MLGVPYVGAGVLGSALAMDKEVCKAVLRDAGIAGRASVTLRRTTSRATRRMPDRVGRARLPVFVKPARLGSSVGISQGARTRDELGDALDLAFAHDDKVLVEQFVAGREVECGVLGDERPMASAVGRDPVARRVVRLRGQVRRGRHGPRRPAGLPPDVTEAGPRHGVPRRLRACEVAGMARVDFFVRPDGALVLNEINTIPGFTGTSVYARLFAACGVPYPALLDRLIELAVARHARQRALAH